MPLGDRTGPGGLGPMTGRAAGYCAGYTVPGYMNSVPRRAFGFGRGFGRGLGRGMGRGFAWRRAGYAWGDDYGYTPLYPVYPERISAEEETGMLAEQAKALEEELKIIKNRLKELESEVKK